MWPWVGIYFFPSLMKGGKQKSRHAFDQANRYAVNSLRLKTSCAGLSLALKTKHRKIRVNHIIFLTRLCLTLFLPLSFFPLSVLFRLDITKCCHLSDENVYRTI